jgi:amidase
VSPTTIAAPLGLRAHADLLAAGGASSAELVDAALERIADAQPVLNAFRCLRADAARAEAAAADRRRADGDRSPLLGVPVAIKDDMDVAGETTPFGCAGDFTVKDADGELVRRLRAAGAIIVGKTTSPEFGQWPVTEGPAFGATRNPWDTDRTPGGSSGGSAAAVAAGGCASRCPTRSRSAARPPGSTRACASRCSGSPACSKASATTSSSRTPPTA